MVHSRAQLRQQLESLREIKLMVRSRAQWLHPGEKPSHFFVTLNAKISLIKHEKNLP